MLLLIKIAIIFLLLMIGVQDLKSRLVYWLAFPLLAVTFVALFGISHRSLNGYWLLSLVNVLFIIILLLLTTVWFSVRGKRWVNVTAGLLGWGDILFIAAVSFCFSPANFMLFYMGSLLVILIGWFIFQQLLASKEQHIPLAGLQALLLVVILITTWCIPRIDVNSDQWLLNKLM